MNQTKRIVIIEGDAFDADAIVAIYGIDGDATEFGVKVDGDTEPYDYEFDSRATRDARMAVAIDAWRGAVGDGTVPHPEPLPFPPVIEPEERIEQFFTDTKGRYYETYGGQTVIWGDTTGRFIWNEGPPRRKNPLGPGASPIVKIYVGQDGKPIDPQPV